MRIESENVDVGDIFKFQVMIIKSETRTTGLVTTSQSGDHNSEGETVSLALGGSVKPELLENPKFLNVWVFVQLILRPMKAKNQLFKFQNIAKLWIFYRLSENAEIV